MEIDDEVKLAEERKESLERTFEQLQAEGSAFLLLASQWNDLRRHFDLSKKSIEQLAEEVSSKEKRLAVEEEKLECRGRVIELKEKELALFERKIEELNGQIVQQDEELLLASDTLEDFSQEIYNKKLELEGIRNELIEKEKKLDYVNGLLEKRNEEVKVKEEKLDEIQEKIEKCIGEVELKEEVLAMLCKAIDGCGDELQSKERYLQSFQESLDEKSNEMSLKQKNLDLIKNKAFEIQMEIKSRENHLDAIKKLIEECTMKLKEKEVQLNQCQDKLGRKEQELQECSEKVQLREKEYKKLSEELQLKERNYERRVKELQDIESALDVRAQMRVEQPDNFPSTESCSHSPSLLSDLSTDGKILQRYVNEYMHLVDIGHHDISTALHMSTDPARLVLDSIQGFYPPDAIDRVGDEDVCIMRKSCIFLLEQLTKGSPQINTLVREEALKLASKWKARIDAENTNLLEVRGFLQLVVSYCLSTEFKAADLQRLLQHHIHASPDIPGSILSYPRVTLNRQEKNTINNDATSSSLSFQFNASTEFQSSLSKCSSVGIQPSDEPRSSENLAKLVLDELQRSFLQYVKGKEKVFEESFLKRCISLLEQLITFACPIDSHLKEEAIKLAVRWKERLNVGTRSTSEILGFLYLLSAYGLVSSFGDDDIIMLIKMVAHCKGAPNLCQSLGFSDKMTVYIQNLVHKKQHVEAVGLIYSLKLVDKFQPVQLLKEFLNNTRQHFNENTRKRKISHDSHAEAIEQELAALKALVKCIREHNIDSDISVNDLDKHIIQLEKRKANLKVSRPGPYSEVNQGNQGEKCREAHDHRYERQQQNENRSFRPFVPVQLGQSAPQYESQLRPQAFVSPNRPSPSPVVHILPRLSALQYGSRPRYGFSPQLGQADDYAGGMGYGLTRTANNRYWYHPQQRS